MRFGGILLAAALLLGACTGDPKPNEPDPSKTPTSEPTPTLTPPEMPEQAKEDNEAGAAAFVTHWIAVYNYSSNTGDTAPLEAVSDPECVGCNDYISLLTDTYEAGGFIKGREWSSEDFGVGYERHGEITIVETELQIGPGELRRTGDAEVTSVPADTSSVTWGLGRSGDHWVATHFGKTPES